MVPEKKRAVQSENIVGEKKKPERRGL